MVDSRINVFFDPDLHPDDTLKSFVDFVKAFGLRYEAAYPDPPKVSLDAALNRWKLTNENADPSLAQYDRIVDEWKGKDMVKKCLGMFSAPRLNSDWEIAQPDEATRKAASWDVFVGTIKQYYQPTENLSVKHFQFRSLSQNSDESFPSFCIRVGKEASHCQFRCSRDDCTAENTAVRDQIIFGLSDDRIREEALKHSWDLCNLRKEGMRLESAAKGASEISGEAKVNRVGKYSLKNAKKSGFKKQISCFHCGLNGPRQDILSHAKQCSAKTSVCSRCDVTGHAAKVCTSGKATVKAIQPSEKVEQADETVYNVNIFRVCQDEGRAKGRSDDFKVQVLVNNHLGKVLADTGAGVSVCGMDTAKEWNLLEKMCDTKVKIKPYKSSTIPTVGVSTCGVSFGDRIVPVQWYIIKDSCEPILAGGMARNLGIIEFNRAPDVLMPVNMIKLTNHELKSELQNAIASMPELFDGVGCLRGHEVKLPVDPSIKPVAEPPRRVHYHLQSRVAEAVQSMLADDIIEEHPSGEEAPWVSNLVVVPKDDGGIRVTLGAVNVNKALLSSNFPIPRQEDIKMKLSGSTVFSKLDLKSAFWQLQIDPTARYMTVFHSGGKLYRYKRLVMGLKPSQGELNAALQPLFAHLSEVHVIHDDIVIATPDDASHVEVVKEVLRVLSESGLTLNESKCLFGSEEIKFWGLLLSADGVRPDPAKVDALDHLTTPKNKEELVSFLCMMQSNADFIQDFSRKASVLRELTKKNARFRWDKRHESCFRDLLNSFRKDVLLRYFDGNLNTYVFVDGHKTGLGAILAQGSSLSEARPVAIASRSTTAAERNYPQLDIEAASLGFGLKRFREYLVGSPTVIKVITDHKPLVPIFNGRRTGSIRTQRIKLNHQDVPYLVGYQKGSLNQADILSRQAKPFSTLPVEHQKEAHELNNLLYMLHATPIVDHISLAQIAKKTDSDPVLSRVRELVRQGAKTASRDDVDDVRRFNQLLADMTVTGNGIILKDDRMVLPESLHNVAIQLAHRGSHPGQSGIERRLRYHFFFHKMFDKVKQFVRECPACSIFVDKKTKEPITHHAIPEKAWETVAVDLFGPMPSSRHVVVVQDIGSRYPAAKLVSSTKASDVVPVLEEIYAEYGYPDTQISDNGPPFSSKSMKDFTESHGVTARFSTPYSPNQNPAETFMKTVGKAMKISTHDKLSESKALRDALVTYRQTPHSATGIPPANVMFRDGVKSEFPRKPSSLRDVSLSRKVDIATKKVRQDKVNLSKYVKHDTVCRGDVVVVRDVVRRSKFDPKFLPDPFVVVDMDEDAKRVVLEGLKDSKLVVRHLDDIKGCHRELRFNDNSIENPPLVRVKGEAQHGVDQEEGMPEVPVELRKSTRERSAPPRYPEREHFV